MKKIDLKFERLIPASPMQVFNGWLNPKTPGNPWSMADKLIFNPKVDGFFYWYISKNPHYGRFTKIQRGSRIEHTWMSPSTGGEETFVTLTFKKKGKDTLMTLLHKGIPNTEDGRGHKDGWNYFMDEFSKKFAARRK